MKTFANLTFFASIALAPTLQFANNHNEPKKENLPWERSTLFSPTPEELFKYIIEHNKHHNITDKSENSRMHTMLAAAQCDTGIIPITKKTAIILGVIGGTILGLNQYLPKKDD